MKSVKTAVLSLVISVMIASASNAQEAPKKAEGNATQQAPTDTSKNFDGRMAKLQQAVSKMQAKVSQVKDPQMKADMDALIAKMKQITDEYNAMKNTAGMSAQQQEQSKKKIKAEMDEARKMHEAMKAKYGNQMGGKAKKETTPAQQEEPAPK